VPSRNARVAQPRWWYGSAVRSGPCHTARVWRRRLRARIALAALQHSACIFSTSKSGFSVRVSGPPYSELQHDVKLKAATVSTEGSVPMHLSASQGARGQRFVKRRSNAGSFITPRASLDRWLRASIGSSQASRWFSRLRASLPLVRSNTSRQLLLNRSKSLSPREASAIRRRSTPKRRRVSDRNGSVRVHRVESVGAPRFTTSGPRPSNGSKSPSSEGREHVRGPVPQRDVRRQKNSRSVADISDISSATRKRPGRRSIVEPSMSPARSEPRACCLQRCG
jgi:hypothetical protein